MYEIQNNLHQLTTDMLTLIMLHNNRFSEKENEIVETHIPQHRDSKTKHRDSPMTSRTMTSRFGD